MDPIILKVYGKDGDREEEIGNLFIKGKESSSREVTYSIAYIPEGKSWNSYRDAIATYQNSMICMMDMKKKGFYLNKKDWETFSLIATTEYYKILNSLKVEETTENKPVLCVTCGEDVGSGFFQIDNHDNYCINCYKKRFSCKDPEVIQKQEEEVNPQAAVGTCYKCHKIYPVNTMHLNPLADGWQCHNCFYEIEEGEDDAKV